MTSFLFAFLAGVSVTMQNSFNGLMNPTLGVMGTAFAGFTMQSILLIVYQLLTKRRLVSLKSVPPAYYLGGFLAAIVVGSVGYCVAQMGSAVTACCSVSGQMLLSAVVDHFGLFGAKRLPFSPKRLPGFCLLLGGVLAMNLLGQNGAQQVPLAVLLFAVLLGGCAILVRTINFKASERTGSAMGGAMVNSLSSAVFGLIFFVLAARGQPDMSIFLAVNPIYYLAGVFGTSCLLCNIAAYRNTNVFYATVFLLVGQVSTGILMDVAVFHALSWGKCVGIALLLAGILLDKLLVQTKSAK